MNTAVCCAASRTKIACAQRYGIFPTHPAREGTGTGLKKQFGDGT